MKLHTKAGAVALVLLNFYVLDAGGAAAAGPAVSGPNGMIEFDAGALSVPSGFVGRVAGTLTLPVGDTFGVQGDFSAAEAGGLGGSAAFHIFTRDPQSYLIGGTLGMIRTPGATIVAGGPEAELYLGRWTLEAWGGVAATHPSAGPARTAPFVMADAAFYPNDNLRLSVGLSLLDGYTALHFGGEYLFDESTMPLALTADARLGQDGSVLATVGLRAYFGAPHKSLILRHREDDPWDRGSSLFTAVGGRAATAPSVTGSPSSGTTDPGGDDPGTGDTGTGDTGTGDAATGNTGTGDAGSGDTGTGDAGTGDNGGGNSTPTCDPLTEAPGPDGVCYPFL